MSMHARVLRCYTHDAVPPSKITAHNQQRYIVLLSVRIIRRKSPPSNSIFTRFNVTTMSPPPPHTHLLKNSFFSHSISILFLSLCICIMYVCLLGARVCVWRIYSSVLSSLPLRTHSIGPYLLFMLFYCFSTYCEKPNSTKFSTSYKELRQIYS